MVMGPWWCLLLVYGALAAKDPRPPQVGNKTVTGERSWWKKSEWGFAAGEVQEEEHEGGTGMSTGVVYAVSAIAGVTLVALVAVIAVIVVTGKRKGRPAQGPQTQDLPSESETSFTEPIPVILRQQLDESMGPTAETQLSLGSEDTGSEATVVTPGRLAGTGVAKKRTFLVPHPAHRPLPLSQRPIPPSPPSADCTTVPLTTYTGPSLSQLTETP